MRLAAFLLSTAALAVQFSITPGKVTQCIGGVGQVKLTWSDAGPRPVQVRLFSRVGPPITGMEGASGESVTGVWVADRMVFVLTDDTGAELARVTASVRCGAVVDPPGNGSFLPLSPGNRWVYRVDSRQATATYEHWWIAGNEEWYGHVYTVLMRDAEKWLLRETEQGQIQRLLDSGAEEVLLDPVAEPARTAMSIGLGDFADVLPVESMTGGLIRENLRYARGVGLVWSTASLMTGSSGGFLSGRQLVEAYVNGRVYTTPAARIEVAAETTVLGVTNKSVTNCAVPCYFTACGLVPGADPEGTYRPCFQARVVTESAPSGSTAELELLDARGQALARRATEAGTVYVQLPLYSQPNVPFPPGAYQLRARVRDAQGVELGQSRLELRIE